MGCECCFCCFRNCNPLFTVTSALVANLFSFAFLIWGLLDLWFKRKVAEGFYITAFILICVIIALLLIIFFLTCCLSPNHYTGINTTGKILCIIVILVCFVAFAFLVVAHICLLVYYGKGRGAHGQAHDWFAIFIPGVISLFTNIYTILSMNYLYDIFANNAQDIPYTHNSPQPYIQNKMTTLPNTSVVVTGNNPNNQPITVFSGTNMN